MNWAGKLGLAGTSEETTPGVFREPITEYPFKGLILRESRGTQPNAHSAGNPDVYVRMAISVIPSALLKDNIMALRYATVGGVKWQVSSYEMEDMRYILNLGDKYV